MDLFSGGDASGGLPGPDTDFGNDMTQAGMSGLDSADSQAGSSANGIANTPGIQTDNTWLTPQRLAAMKAASTQLGQDQKAAGENSQTKMALTQPAQPVKLAQAQTQHPSMPGLQIKPGQIQAAALQGPVKVFAAGGAMVHHPAMPGVRMRPGNPAMARPMHPVGQLQKIPATFSRGGALEPMQYRDNGGSIAPAILNRILALRGQHAQTPMQPQGQLRTGLQVGPGTGRSDSILSRAGGGEIATGDGEYVIPSDVTSWAGQGSSTAGGKVFDDLVHHARAHARRELGALPAPKQAGEP